MRLNKYISDSGLCSRRQADKYIEQGHVLINGKKALLSDKVKPRDVVMVNGHAIEPLKDEDAVYIAFNKPVGIVSTTEAGTKDNIIEYIHHSQRIFPIGRLDKDSQGLIFLTSNGDIVNKILRAGNKHEKEYLVTVNKPVTDQFVEGMASGVPILGSTTKKCAVTKEGPTIFRIILVQGLNRQIRRMCEYFGYEVTKLERIRIMNITLKGLPTGDWRDLTPQEMENIFKLIEQSESAVAPAKKADATAGAPTGSKTNKAPHRNGPRSTAPFKAGAKAADKTARPGKSGRSKSSGASKSAGRSSKPASGGKGRGKARPR
ncbi:23S rRNA pseudouridine(2604) synthase RluF [Pontibacter qinzhouensis]|uniref:Pseudouridine synthase n=1 Tax=Pontibacter qinzhouensis TaxID=2603253 RepID=A0A5C8J7H9_9BACT|nr:23S rRNA pseudouridine(2604) synthase RluF [Pontibacter qinzhouensis]TXK33226.1 23S rRNA pseudouridine(2604) synthase RluF [Pontibacter qinzhouensis]